MGWDGMGWDGTGLCEDAGVDVMGYAVDTVGWCGMVWDVSRFSLRVSLLGRGEASS